MDNNESLSLKNHPVELTRVLKSYQLFRIFLMNLVQYHSDFLSLVSTLTDHPFFFCQFFSSGNGGFSPNKFKKGTETVEAPKNYFQRQNFRPPYFFYFGISLDRLSPTYFRDLFFRIIFSLIFLARIIWRFHGQGQTWVISTKSRKYHRLVWSSH